jgi:hypothetical protein
MKNVYASLPANNKISAAVNTSLKSRNKRFNNRILLISAITLLVGFLLGLTNITNAQTTQTYITSGSFLPPAGVVSVKVEVWGGGGAGGGSTANKRPGGGGGGGGYSVNSDVTVSSSSNYNITVGNVVSGSTGNGGNGNTSSAVFGSTTISANGGLGGLAGNPPTGGTGGTGSNYNGGNGWTPTTNANGPGGGGGSSAGISANGNNATSQTGASAPSGGGAGGNGGNAANNGVAGSNPGGGGGGAGDKGGSNTTGGNGARGEVKITYICPTYSLTSTSATNVTCPSTTSTVTLTGNAANLPVGAYTVIYSLSGANIASNSTASMTVSTAGTGTFNASGIVNGGSTTITVNSLGSGSGNGVNPLCSSSLSANNTATVTSSTNTAGSPSSNPTLCINTAISPNITITTTGATGIGSPTGLPSGVSASWASNTITINGTPNSSGIFNYSIPLTGGCGSVSASGTINVTANATITLTSAGGTDAQTLCINSLLTNITYTIGGSGTSASVTGLPSGVNGNYSAGVFTISGTPTQSGIFNYTVNTTGPCATPTANGTITVSPFAWVGGTSGAWETPSNWCGGVPTSGTDVVLPADASVTVNATGAACNNLTMTTGAILTINSGGQLTVNGTFTKSTSNSDLVIIDGGSLINNTSGVHGTAERSVTASAYHFLSSPVASTTFGNVFPNNQNLIWAQVYDEPSGTWINQTISSNLIRGIGYSVWIDPTIGNQTALFSGIFNITSEVETLSHLNGGSDENLIGWNLLGNPFTSGLDWDQGTWNRGAGVDGSVYIWDGTQYLSWNGTTGGIANGVIPQQNGFFVKTTIDESSITIPSDARVHSGQSLYKDAVPDLLQFSIDGNGYRDDTYIQFLPVATSGFDHIGDAYKLWGITEAPQLYSIIPGDVLSINALPSTEENPVVSLGLKVGVETSYSITASGMNSFDPYLPIRLDDLKLGITQDLRLNDTYTFTASPNDPENRFNVRFYSPVGTEKPILDNFIVYADHGWIVVNNSGNYSGLISVYNTAGQLILSDEMKPGTNKIAAIPLGIYIVKAVTNKTIFSQKVVLF